MHSAINLAGCFCVLYITPFLYLKTKNASTALRVAHQCMVIYRVDVLSIKKGIPLYPNLVNLKI